LKNQSLFYVIESNVIKLYQNRGKGLVPSESLFLSPAFVFSVAMNDLLNDVLQGGKKLRFLFKISVRYLSPIIINISTGTIERSSLFLPPVKLNTMFCFVHFFIQNDNTKDKVFFYVEMFFLTFLPSQFSFLYILIKKGDH
jgi:hypothetical protein